MFFFFFAYVCESDVCVCVCAGIRRTTPSRILDARGRKPPRVSYSYFHPPPPLPNDASKSKTKKGLYTLLHSSAATAVRAPFLRAEGERLTFPLRLSSFLVRLSHMRANEID